jgi:hypothetical protein
MTMPIPTPIYRMVHVDNLDTILRRQGMHSTNHIPDDGLPYRTIHNMDIQNERHARRITCGPGGTLHDYVPFYFGYLSPMLLQLKTNRVAGYTEGQQPLIYLASTAQTIATSKCRFVLSNGHGIAAFTQWFDDIDRLDEVDWDMVYQRYWSDNVDDMDRQRRKQAEFLVYRFCPWTLIQEIGVVNNEAKSRVNAVLNNYDESVRRPVNVRGIWYY